MSVTWQSYVNTMEPVSTAMVHIFVTALLDGKDNAVKMVRKYYCITRIWNEHFWFKQSNILKTSD